MKKRTLQQLQSGLPWLLVGILATMLWQSQSAGAAPPPAPLQAGPPPEMISYQGQVNVGGTPFDGTGAFKFAIVNNGGGTTYWSNDGTSVAGSEPTAAVSLVVNNGLFNVLLGDTSLTNMTLSLGNNVFAESETYLRIWFNGGSGFEQLTPDTRIASVAYALHADTAETVPALEARVAALEDLLMHFSRTGNDIFIKGANLHVVNGTGSTDGKTNNLGNIIIGYNELRGGGGDDRTGSHMLVVGTRNNYSSFGGIVVGVDNTTSGNYASVSGGNSNTASGNSASVSGGVQNTAGVKIGLCDTSGDGASVSGGSNNMACGQATSISGGGANLAYGGNASVSGGGQNTAAATNASVSGGQQNFASGPSASVSGGERNSASGPNASVSGGSVSTASGGNASVSGGILNAASGGNASVSGGQGNTASGGNASVSGGRGNLASGGNASVSGGQNNHATGKNASVSGGDTNTSGNFASVSGGQGNTASGNFASVSGGQNNQATGDHSSVSGGDYLSNPSAGNWYAEGLVFPLD